MTQPAPLTRLPGTPPSPWIEQDTTRLRLMWREGVSIDCIARELGRSIGAIDNRAYRLQLMPRRTRYVGGPFDAQWPTGLPADLRYEDDPRAVSAFDRLPALRRGNMTAALMGDPVPRGNFT